MTRRLFTLLLTLVLVGSLAACKMPAGGGAASPTSSPTPTRAEYTQPPQTTPTRAESVPTPSPTPAFCLVETGQPAGTVYIRRGPGMSFPVVGYTIQGERLELTGHTDPAGWAEVRTAGGVMGWFYVPAWCANKLNSKKGE